MACKLGVKPPWLEENDLYYIQMDSIGVLNYSLMILLVNFNIPDYFSCIIQLCNSH